MMDKRAKEGMFLVIGLLALALALYVTFYRTVPKSAVPPTAKAQVPAKEPAPTPEAPTIPVGPGSPPGRNPFVGSAQAAPGQPAPGAPAAPTPPGQPPGQAAPPPTAPPQEPLALLGIITGNPTVAVIRSGEKRYIVKPGDRVGANYVVRSIGAGRVVLSSPQGQLTLKLGAD